MKISTPIDRQDLHIKRSDRVLEVGPGHNPTYRADVLAEKFMDSNAERCGDVRFYSHQQLIHAAGEDLPFADKEFDYVICNQVLEHSDNPAQFLRELMRVAKGGYIETPSLIGEMLFPKETHRQLLLSIDGKLVIYDKKRMINEGGYCQNYGELFLNYLPYQSLPFRLLTFTEQDLMIVRYEWKDDIDFIINPEDDYYKSFFTKKWDRAMVEKLFPPRSTLTEIGRAMRSIYYMLKEKLIARLVPHKSTTWETYCKQHGKEK
ncbi:MAG: class I SAM-dependent methyltransferase [Alistipes sp.]